MNTKALRILAVVVSIASISGVASANGFGAKPSSSAKGSSGGNAAAEKAAEEIKTLTKEIATKDAAAEAKTKEAAPLVKIVDAEKKFFDHIPFAEQRGKPGWMKHDARWKKLVENEDKMNAIFVQRQDLQRESMKLKERVSALKKEFPSLR